MSNMCSLCFFYASDVIGIVQDVVKTQMGGGGKKYYANIMLRDEVGNFIEVVL